MPFSLFPLFDRLASVQSLLSLSCLVLSGGRPPHRQQLQHLQHHHATTTTSNGSIFTSALYQSTLQQQQQHCQLFSLLLDGTAQAHTRTLLLTHILSNRRPRRRKYIPHFSSHLVPAEVPGGLSFLKSCTTVLLKLLLLLTLTLSRTPLVRR